MAAGRQVNIINNDGRVVWSFRNEPGGRVRGLDQKSQKAMSGLFVPSPDDTGEGVTPDMGDTYLDGLFYAFHGPPGLHAEEAGGAKPGTMAPEGELAHE